MSNADFFQRLTEILNNVVEAGANNALLRYMTADSLKYIVDPSADIACSNFLYHDESKEIIAGARRFLDWLVGNVSLSAAHREALDSKIVALVRERASSCPFVPYVFCLTERKDEPAYWCRRAGDGGFAVAFDKNALRERIGAVNALPAGSPFGGRLMFLMPVLCLKSNSQHIPLFFDLLYKQRRDAFDRYAKDDPSADCNDALAQILVAAAIVKDEKHSVKREWRLVLLPTSEDVREAKDSLASAIKEGQKFPKPSLKTGILKTPAQGDLREIVRCIFVSPQGDRNKLRSQLVDRLRALPSPLTGDEVVADGLLFVRNSAHSAVNLCNQCAIRLTCPDRKPDAVIKPKEGSRAIGGSVGCNPVGNKGKEWNKPSANQPLKKGGAKAPSKVKGIVAGLVTAIALGALCLWLFSGGEDSPRAKADKERGLIKEATPVKAPTNRVAVAKPSKPKPDENGVMDPGPPPNFHGSVITNDNGLVYYSRDPGFAERYQRAHATIAAMPFHTRAENEIAAVFLTKPGSMVLESAFPANLEEDFLKHLDDPIKDLPTDSEENKAAKQLMRELKPQFKAAIDRGEKLADLLKDYRRELGKAQMLKENLRTELAKIRQNATDENDVRDAIEAANTMLEEYGIEHFPIKITPGLKRHIEINKENLGNQKGNTL